MKYKEAMAFLEETRSLGSQLGLSTLNRLLNYLSHPERCLKFIHVAGTNGKGSTCAFTASILSASDYKVGVFSSPAVNAFNEQIQVWGPGDDQKQISNDDIALHMTEIRKCIEQMVREGHAQPTEFEILTAMAFMHFKMTNCDFVVLEVGLGGLTDATNVIDTPLVAAITPIDMDHVNFLGDTIEAIAQMKAGIIKPEGITVTGEQVPEAMHVIECTCLSNHNKLIKVNPDNFKTVRMSPEALIVEYQQIKMTLGLTAPYQVQNAMLAITIIEVLISYYHYPITHNMIRKGLESAKWPSRFEIISKHPVTVIDGAHNLHGITALRDTLTRYYQGQKIVGIIGLLADKDINGMLETILPVLDEVIVTKSNNPRTLSPKALGDAVSAIAPDKLKAVCETVEEAVRKGMAYHDQEMIIVYFGSLYYLGEVREHYLKNNL